MPYKICRPNYLFQNPGSLSIDTGVEVEPRGALTSIVAPPLSTHLRSLVDAFIVPSWRSSKRRMLAGFVRFVNDDEDHDNHEDDDLIEALIDQSLQIAFERGFSLLEPYRQEISICLCATLREQRQRKKSHYGYRMMRSWRSNVCTERVSIVCCSHQI